ncbi:MAG TPA: DUF1697 domain-containing protein [Actinomycetota bacterium]|nr:DUF1697 domain-containing protein [Actinomycetota bacterium]
MAVQVAFLRAINVGARRVSMQKLRDAFEKMSLDDVETFIASGNVIFRSTRKAADLEGVISAKLEKALGFEVVTFVRSAAQIKRIVAAPPFRSPADVHVGFLKKAASAGAKKALDEISNDVDSVTAKGREVFWLARQGMGRATVSGAKLEKALGQPTTLRSLKMLRRLESKLT